jgi:hypothetical protein
MIIDGLKLDSDGNPVDLESALKIIETHNERFKNAHERFIECEKSLHDCKVMQFALEKSINREKVTFICGMAWGITLCTSIILIKHFFGF